MAGVHDENGEEAVNGKSLGYWLCEADFVSSASLPAKSLGSVGFPRDWPNVYTSSKALKSLVGKKGQCAGKKVGVVSPPLPEEIKLVKGLSFQPLQSFSNAERAEKAAGLPVVRGWLISEHLDKAVSEAFVAERYWWNAMPDGKWVDFTPRPEGSGDILLAEAVDGAPKSRTKLSAAEADLISSLLRQRFPALAAAQEPAPVAHKKQPAVAVTATSVPHVPAPEPAPVQPKVAAGKAQVSPSLRDLMRRVQSGDVDAVRTLEDELRDNEELAVQVAGDGLLRPLVKLLGEEAKSQAALSLLLSLTDAAVGQKCGEIGSEIIACGGVDALAKKIRSGSPAAQELAAAALGNLCHESPENQDKVAESGILQPLVALLSEGTHVAQEAAYAIWNLTVGHEENCNQAVRFGAIPKLAELLKSTSDIAQENAAGALMHVTMSPEARAAIAKVDVIPRLCELVSPSYEPEVSTQAAGALLNLASDSQDYAKMIVDRGAIGPLVALAKDGPELAREYAAGALMNLMRGDAEVAETASKKGAIPVLASLVHKPTGQSEALGALANLASGSSERQIAIYKAQVTRRSVALLNDPDVDVRRSAAALLMNLAPHAKIKERICEAGALKPLAAALKDQDEAIKERAAGALANLFNDHSANVHAGFEQAPEMIPALIAILQEPAMSEDGKRQAAHALAMLAAEDGPCDAVWRAGAGPPLLAMLAEMVPEAALGIMNLSWRWPEVKQELAKGKTLDHLMEMLRMEDPMAKEYAAGALMNMTAGSPENAEKTAKVVPELTALLDADGIQAAEWAAGALANIVRAGPEVQQAAVNAGAATFLAALLRKVTANGKSLVVLALTALAENQAPAVQSALGAREKAKLRDFRDSGTEDLQEYTNSLVEKLGSSFTL